MICWSISNFILVKSVPNFAVEFYTEFRRCFDIIVDRASSFPLCDGSISTDFRTTFFLRYSTMN
jgi:hypothetical protein